MRPSRWLLPTLLVLATLGAPALAPAQVGVADLYSEPNYALSKLPIATCRDAAGVVLSPAVTCRQDSECPGYLPPFLVGANQYPGGATCSGPAVAGTGIRKFVDTLPGLCALGQRNGLGSCLPVAVPDRATFPDSDYYELGVTEYQTRFHSDIPQPAKERGFLQLNTTDPDASKNAFLGPLIIGRSYRPVRMKLVNQLPTGAAGDLFLPTDTTLSGTGNGPDGTPYTQNRIAVHLHGGNSPWISDGTQHQWTVPAGEATTHKKGLAAAYVPDMWFDASGLVTACSGSTTCNVPGAHNDPGDGMLTYYWPNEQSGRLMFYHDHAYGITRLNVMAGVAAGYLLVDPTDEDALAAAGVPGTVGSLYFDPGATPTTGQPAPTAPDLAHLIPLVIQDRTFVPPPDQLAVQDRTWDVAKWGGEGSVWLPHVYTPNQWPDAPDLSGTNPYGRWDYGAWFWPPQQSLTSLDGAPRDLTLPCTSAAAVTAANPTGQTVCPNIPNPSLTPESFLDTPIVNGTAYPTLTVDPVRYRFQILNAANDRYWNLSLFVATSHPQSPVANSEVQMVEAIPDYLPNIAHTGFARTPALCPPGTPLSQVTGLPVGPDLASPACYPQSWPTDGRQGGAPDPTLAGPRWVQIGTEGGILPKAAVIPPKPTVYEMNKRNIVVLNVADKSLLLGPAERADVVVDFSQYAGKTLILYNDAPAPVPASDPRSDFYTWSPDLTGNGGAPTVLPGYGPNTRTIMQIVVNAAGGTAPPPLDDAEVARITAALQARFQASQLKPIVPEAVYSGMYDPATVYSDTYVPINAQSITMTPVGGAAPVTLPFEWKALHELFSTDYGRMNSLLAVEIPATNWLVQTTIPFANFDPATDFISDGLPMLWKVTHNGVDTHAIHFHLMNVQVINRVGWDGQIRPPDANELGWKETVRMNPLEDIYLALQPVKQHLPWPLPDSIRPLDVDRPLGTRSQFTGVDIYNNPINVANQVFNFGQEYVWHCHLLGHEENDMLRAEVFVVAPEAPDALTAFEIARPRVRGQLAWRDNSASAMSFTLQRDVDPAFPNPTTFTVAAPAAQPGPVSFVDPGPIDVATTYYYRVRAEKALSSPAIPGTVWNATSDWSATAQMQAAAIAQVTPASLAFGTRSVGSTSTAQRATLTNVGGLPLSFTSSTLSGANAADWVITGTTCGATLASGASCTVSVAFRPTAVGPRTARLDVVTSSAFAPTQSVALSGTGVAPNASVSPTSLTFPGQNVATTSAPQVIVLSNDGGATLGSIVIGTTGNFARTTGTGSCGSTLAAGASCRIYVTFRPTASGTRTGSVNIASNDPVHPTITVPATGWGNYPKATGLTVAASPVSPTYPGTAVTFTATGSGAPAGTPYLYRFALSNGATTVLVQDWSTVATWTWPIPLLQQPGTYTVIADVETNPGPSPDVTRNAAYDVAPLPPATSLVLDATPIGTAAPATPVTITATAGGSTAPYEYQFLLLDPVSNTWSVVQAWSGTSTWAWTTPALSAGSTTDVYQVQAQVRTSPWVTFDQQVTSSYTVQ
jgi:FtsP/CotA-like multicopper oxidase with cupredoxin domain